MKQLPLPLKFKGEKAVDEDTITLEDAMEDFIEVEASPTFVFDPSLDWTTTSSVWLTLEDT